MRVHAWVWVGGCAVDMVSLLEESCVDYGHIIDMDPTEQAAAVEGAIETMLARLDELGLMVESLTADTNQTKDIVPALKVHLQGLEQTYAQLDALVALVARIEASVDAVDAAVTASEQRVASKLTRKLTSFFSRKKKAAAAAADDDPSACLVPPQAIFSADDVFAAPSTGAPAAAPAPLAADA